MSKVLVIGYGNSLRGDDGIGWLAAEMLQASLPDIEICTAMQLYPEMAATLSTVNHAIFIDASVEGKPGQITDCCLAPISSPPSSLAHFFDPRQLLASTLALYGRAPNAYLYTVTGAVFEVGADLSLPVQLALPHLIQEIEQLCRHLCVKDCFNA